MRSLETDIGLRAAAILLVALNHALPYHQPNLTGGMILLMTLSGFGIARFGMAERDPTSTVSFLFRLTLKILLPSLLLVLFFFVLLQKFDLRELLFVRNWWDATRISKFPTWYPQVFWQMMAILAVGFSIPAVASGFFRRPALWSVVACVVFLAIARIQTNLWAGGPGLNYPHLYLWAIALGWACWFLLEHEKVRLLAPLLAVACAWVLWSPDQVQFWTLSGGVALLTFVPRVRLPSLLVVPVEVVAQATFTIFLLHRFFYEVFEDLFYRFTTNGVVMWAFGVLASLAVWLAIVSVSRAYRVTEKALFAAAPA